MKQVLILILVVAFSLYTIKSKTSLGCLDPAGKEVDWNVILSFPKTSDPKGELNYGYFDNKSKKIEYYIVEDVTDFPPVRLTNELNQSNKKGSEDTNYFVWNDDMTIGDEKKSASSSKAHSKGILAYDKTSGFLLVHSLPRFPYRTADSLSFLEDLPDNTGVYAQSFLCVTLTKSQALKSIEQLLIINPQLIMKHSEDEDFVDTPANANVIKFLRNRADRNLAESDMLELFSKNKEIFTVFSKGKNHGELPWDEVIPSIYKQSFYVETWTKPSRLPPVCKSKYKVNNVNTLKFSLYEYTCNNEHSKWAISTKIVCIGDLNRTESQQKRGGLVICFENENLAGEMKKAIQDFESCSDNLRFLQDE